MRAMDGNVSPTMSEDAQRILHSHLKIGPEKAVSYLPIRTVERVIGITIEDYEIMIRNSGNQCSVFSAEECCISSGAIFAYSERDLDDVLKEYYILLSMHQWPTNSKGFIKKIASEWLEQGHDIMPVVRRAFGDRGVASQI